MRIISGKLKGRKIVGYDIDGTRPTMDRIKESLFAMIQNYIDESVVLDLFSGSGNLGIEALSMGSKYAYFVDNNKKAYNTIKKNIEDIGIENYNILNTDYKKALEYYKDNNIKFNIIFLDPPYKTNYIEKSIELIDKYKLLSKEGIIVAESSDIDKIVFSSNYRVIKEKKYKDKLVVILKQV